MKMIDKNIRQSFRSLMPKNSIHRKYIEENPEAIEEFVLAGILAGAKNQTYFKNAFIVFELFIERERDKNLANAALEKRKRIVGNLTKASKKYLKKIFTRGYSDEYLVQAIRLELIESLKAIARDSDTLMMYEANKVNVETIRHYLQNEIDSVTPKSINIPPSYRDNDFAIEKMRHLYNKARGRIEVYTNMYFRIKEGRRIENVYASRNKIDSKIKQKVEKIEDEYNSEHFLSLDDIKDGWHND